MSFERAIVLIGFLLPMGCSEQVVANADGQGGGTATSSGSGAGQGQECDLDHPCPEGQFCRSLLNTCGVGLGWCETPDPACEDSGEPVCGCDGQLYPSFCAARAALVGVGPARRCELPQGTFACGTAICSDGEYCESLADEGFECKPLPAGCSPDDTCEACFPDGPPGFQCWCDDSASEIRVVCN